MTASPPQPIFLSDEAFDLLVIRAPNEVLRGFEINSFDQAIGTSRERFEAITAALSSGGRAQGFLGVETATYLCNALRTVVRQWDAEEFQTRIGYHRDDAVNMLRQIAFRTGADTSEGE